jgi:hypothetical protein
MQKPDKLMGQRCISRSGRLRYEQEVSEVHDSRLAEVGTFVDRFPEDRMTGAVGGREKQARIGPPCPRTLARIIHQG